MRKPITKLDEVGDKEMAIQLATAIEQYIREIALEIKHQAETELESFKKKVDEGKTQYLVEIESYDPLEVVKNPEKLAIYTKQRDHIYSGPLSLSDSQQWAKILNQAQDVATLSQLTHTQDGQLVLLKRTFDCPEYTMAHLEYDLITLQLHPPHRVEEADTLQAKLAVMVETAKQYADLAKTETDETRKKTIEIMKAKFESFKQNALSKVDAELARRKEQANPDQVVNDLEKALISRHTIQVLGPEIGSFKEKYYLLYTLNLNTYLKLCPNPTRMEILEPIDFDLAESFSQLLNQENVFLPISFKGQALKSKTMPFFIFDFNKFESDWSVCDASYWAAYNNEKVQFMDGSFSIPELSEKLRTLRGKLEESRNRFPGDVGMFESMFKACYDAMIKKEAELSHRFCLSRTIGVR